MVNKASNVSFICSIYNHFFADFKQLKFMQSSNELLMLRSNISINLGTEYDSEEGRDLHNSPCPVNGTGPPSGPQYYVSPVPHGTR